MYTRIHYSCMPSSLVYKPLTQLSYLWLANMKKIASSQFWGTKMMTVATFCGSLVLLHWSAKKVAKSKYNEVYMYMYKQLKKGTRPTLQRDVHHCERTEVVQSLTKSNTRKEDQNVLFIVVGPVGCGKSWVVRKVCNFISEVSDLNTITLDDLKFEFCRVPFTIIFVTREALQAAWPVLVACPSQWEGTFGRSLASHCSDGWEREERHTNPGLSFLVISVLLCRMYSMC